MKRRLAMQHLWQVKQFNIDSKAAECGFYPAANISMPKIKSNVNTLDTCDVYH